MNECMYNGCENERRDVRGSAGRFCSNECYNAYSFKQKREMDKTVAGIAEAIADGLNGDTQADKNANQAE